MNTLATELQPLSAEDFASLEAWLTARRMSFPETPDWEFCEGFLAALVCCRRAIAPSEYWPRLLGLAADAVPANVSSLWTRRWALVEQALDTRVSALDDPAAYQPELGESDDAFAQRPAQRQGAAVARGRAEAAARAHAARHRRAHPARLSRPARRAPCERRANEGRGRCDLGGLQPARNLEEPGPARRDGETRHGRAGPQRCLLLREREEVQEMLRLTWCGISSNPAAMTSRWSRSTAASASGSAPCSQAPCASGASSASTRAWFSS